MLCDKSTNPHAVGIIVLRASYLRVPNVYLASLVYRLEQRQCSRSA